MQRALDRLQGLTPAEIYTLPDDTILIPTPSSGGAATYEKRASEVAALLRKMPNWPSTRRTGWHQP